MRGVRLLEQIINTDVIKCGECNEDFGSKLLCAGFNVAVFALCNADFVGDMLLCVVVIFTQTVKKLRTILRNRLTLNLLFVTMVTNPVYTKNGGKYLCCNP